MIFSGRGSNNLIVCYPSELAGERAHESEMDASLLDIDLKSFFESGLNLRKPFASGWIHGVAWTSVSRASKEQAYIAKHRLA